MIINAILGGAAGGLIMLGLSFVISIWGRQ